MQAVPEVGWNLPIWLLLIVGFVLGSLFAASRRRRHEPAQAIVKLLVLAAALLGALVLVTYSARQVIQIESPQSPRAPLAAAPPQPVPLAASVVADQVEAKSDSVPASAELPEWTRQPRHVDGKRTLMTVKSGRFASRDEAESTAFDEAAKAAAQEFRDLDPRGVGDRFIAQVEMVRHSAVKQRFDEVTEHDFGKFKAPMYQVWLQIELTPELGEQIAEPWRQAAIDARLRTLTGWGLWSTAVAALVAFAFRLDSAWNGRRRAVVIGAAIVLTLGSLAFLA